MALIARFVLGLTFVFSGFVKAIDPLGTTYKIKDYLDAFHWTAFHECALPLAIALIVFEMALGLTLLAGSWKKTVSWLTFVFISLMTVLTLFLAIKNPISDCGCFGDVVILSNWQTFEKNVILWILSLLFLLYPDELPYVFGRYFSLGALLLSLAFPWILCHYSLRHLPMLDVLPYKIGTVLEDNMVIPEDAPTDSVLVEYLYEKEGQRQWFTIDDCPWDDSTWQYVERREQIIRQGYQPPIHDFEMFHPDRGDISQEILNNPSYTFLWVSQKLEQADRRSVSTLKQLQDYVEGYGYQLYGLTSSLTDRMEEWNDMYDLDLDFCSMDEITLKTMVRSNPGLLLIKNGQVLNKWSSSDMKAVEKYLSDDLDSSYLGQVKNVHEGRNVLMFFISVVAAFLLLFVLQSLYKSIYKSKTL